MEIVHREEVVATIQPLVKSFFEKMTIERWESLKLTTPDFATTAMLAELILGVISEVSNLLLKSSRSEGVFVDQQSISSVMKDVVIQTIVDVLDIQEDVHSDNSRVLTNLIVEEVTDMVNSNISSEAPSAQHTPPPKRLSKMIGVGSNMLRDLMATMRCLPVSKSRWREERSDTETPVQGISIIQVGDDCIIKESPVKWVEHEPVMDGRAELSETPLLRTETPEVIMLNSIERASETSEIVHEVMTKAVNEFAEPFLDDIAEADSQLIASRLGEDTEEAVCDIVMDLDKQLMGYESSKDPSQKPNVSFKGPENTIRAFFGRQYAKISILRIVTQLKAKHCTGDKTESGLSLEEVIDRVDSLLEEQSPQVVGNEVNQFQNLRKVSLGEAEMFISGLRELLLDGVYDVKVTSHQEQLEETSSTRGKQSRCSSSVAIDVEVMIQRFLGLMKWWFMVENSNHTDRVLLALINARGAEVKQVEPEPTRKTADEKMKTPVFLLTNTVVTQAFNKAGASSVHTGRIRDSTLDWLFGEVWSEVDSEGLDIDNTTLKKVEKDIVNVLYDELGSVEKVLCALTLQKAQVPQIVISCLKDF